jgi:hypothetical protein
VARLEIAKKHKRAMRLQGLKKERKFLINMIRFGSLSYKLQGCLNEIKN